MRPKVFCIGFQKTGTSSIGAALGILGYKVHRGFRFNLPGKVQLSEPVTRAKLADIALPLTKAYSGFQDNPWGLLYREIDAAYPDARFVLTRRDSEDWADSLIGHFRDEDNPTFRYIYGCDNAPQRSRAHFIRIYEYHNQSVLAYFKNRPRDLLQFDLETANWPQLCQFLERRKPLFREYPHRNAAQARERNSARKRSIDYASSAPATSFTSKPR